MGRTLHAIALADAVAREGGRVLLIDADLEAPGITWMFAGHGKRVDFSYEDFLALLHASADGRPDEAVSLGAAYLPQPGVRRRHRHADAAFPRRYRTTQDRTH